MKQIPVKEETDPDPLPHLMILTLLADYCRQFLLDFIKENDTAICCTKVKMWTTFESAQILQQCFEIMQAHMDYKI